MSSPARSLLLTELSWVEVEDHLARDRRLIVPVGACDQHGPHLPIGATTLVAEALAADFSRDFGILRAPTLDYGVNLPAARAFAGTAGLSEKTLHRQLNDLLAAWEDHGFEEFVLLTVHGFEAHVEAIATVAGTRARVRVVEALNLSFGDLLDGPGPPEHGGEVVTSLMLHLYPERVRMDRAEDALLRAGRRHRAARLTRLPADSQGSVGAPTLATAEKGRRLYDFIAQKIRAKVFLAPPDREEEE